MNSPKFPGPVGILPFTPPLSLWSDMTGGSTFSQKPGYERQTVKFEIRTDEIVRFSGLVFRLQILYFAVVTSTCRGLGPSKGVLHCIDNRTWCCPNERFTCEPSET